MRISIVTVYNSYNCGSFLQSFSMCKALSDFGNEVSFLKRDIYKTNKLHNRIIFAIKQMIRGNSKRAVHVIKEYFIYKKIIKNMSVVETTDDMDLVVYGSDTIWNMEDTYFKENWKRYWGFGVKNKKITYAASVGSTNAELFFENPVYKECINEFSGVAVRDEYTYNIASTLLENGKQPARVVDPTMLLSVDEFDEVMGFCEERNFILLYLSGKLTQKQKFNIEKFAKEHNKKIITFGKDIPFDPTLMLAYYKEADYVITNTFHGNVFSIIYNKNFISYGKEKKKVDNLLNEFGLSSRLINLDDDIDNLFFEKIDYNSVNDILDKKRAQSLEYLGQFLN